MKRYVMILMLILCSFSVAAVKLGNGYLAKSNVTGLENAMIRVQNQETVEKLEAVMEKIQEKNRERLQKMENLQFRVDSRGDVIAEGKKEAKLFGLFKVKHRYECRITESGETERSWKFSDMFFSDFEKVC